MNTSRDITFHLISNAHLDPVWLWDWRDGMNEALITTRTILELMEEFPELTTIRGEAAFYQHVERHDPEALALIKKFVAEKRWDVVGGTHIQPDTNLTGTETYCRHFAQSQAWFKRAFGFAPTAAWAADSFGHSAGLVDIFAAAGMDSFAFTRPFERDLRLDKPAFWWTSKAGGRVLGYRPITGVYCHERDGHNDLLNRLDGALEVVPQTDIDNIGIFYGLGDHGGGPTRLMLLQLREWAGQHPEIKIVHSGLTPFFAALRAEAAAKGGDGFFPTHCGELNFTLRGCYASAAKFKFEYRRAEARVAQAEAVTEAVHTLLPGSPRPAFAPMWDAICFNSFHDILPGTSIERAYDDQIAWLHAATHPAVVNELGALNFLARHVDTRRHTPPPDHLPGGTVQLVFNPHPWPVKTHFELESTMDWRPIEIYNHRPEECPTVLRDHDGAPLPHQTIPNEAQYPPWVVWRRRAVVPVSLPAMGWTLLEYAWLENPPAPVDTRTSPVAQASGNGITNGFLTLSAQPGQPHVQILRDGAPWLAAPGFHAITVEDPHGSWGEERNCSDIRHTWEITHAYATESGPERAALFVRLAGGNSTLDLTFRLCRGGRHVEVAARLLWNERAARLKLVFPCDPKSAAYNVLGTTLERGLDAGEVPANHWVKTDALGFASDSLYCFDIHGNALRASVVRSVTGYAAPAIPAADANLHIPVCDRGQLRFKFLVTPDVENLPRLSAELEQPLFNTPVSCTPGALPRTGSLLELAPHGDVQLLGLKTPEVPAPGTWVLRVQESAGRDTPAQLRIAGQTLSLGILAPYTFQSYLLRNDNGAWSAAPVGLQE
ncbi:MAG: glycoside hydrolase family 38 [Kiritimatiellaeota bacterium]|nr:glycoside hydrolase family 38 [Kiritimatiellota bacterium]